MAPKVSKGRPESPLVAPAGAKPSALAKKDIAKYLANNLKGRAPAIRSTAFHTIFLVTE